MSDLKTPQRIQIIPAILATTQEEYRQKLEKIEDSEQFVGGWIQIDFMDNKFVQNKSIGVDVVKKYPTSLNIEAHLMNYYPDNWIDDLVKANVKRIIFPIEVGGEIDDRIEHIRNHQIEVGLSLNPETRVEKVIPFVDKIDLVLIMSVHPGFSGQQFIEESINKVKTISEYRLPNNYFSIEVDGGINEKVVDDLIKAGADNLVIGSHLIDGDIKNNLAKIWQSATS